MKKIIAETSKTAGLILLGLILAGLVGWIRRHGLIDSPGQYYTYSISEYIILGSLLSITAALLGGLITQLVLRGFGLPPLF